MLRFSSSLGDMRDSEIRYTHPGAHIFDCVTVVEIYFYLHIISMIIFRFWALLFFIVDYILNTFVEHGYGINN